MSEIPETKANFLRNEIDCSDCNIKKQLKRKEQEYNRLSNLITSTKAYEITCSNCRDAILTAPTISGRTKFSQIEVEESSLKMIKYAIYYRFILVKQC